MTSATDEFTVQWLKDTFLTGVDLTLDDGTPYPDTHFQHTLRGAVRTVEHELDIHLDTVTIEGEGHDAYEPNRQGWWPFKLDHRPLLSVEGLTIRWGNFEPVDFPVSWVKRVNDLQAQIHLMPSEEAPGSYQFTTGAPLITGNVFQPADYIPGYFSFDYTAGFPRPTGSEELTGDVAALKVELSTPIPHTKYSVTAEVIDEDAGDVTVEDAAVKVTGKSKGAFTLSVSGLTGGGDFRLDWTVQSIPDDIRHVIGLIAAMLPLDVAGDLLIGAGIAQVHTSMDGLSQSIGTTSSATNAGYGARVRSFERSLERLLPQVRGQWGTPPNMGVI